MTTFQVPMRHALARADHSCHLHARVPCWAILPHLPTATQACGGRLAWRLRLTDRRQCSGLGLGAAVLQDRPVLLGNGLLAYTFGLRHAVDADHIAAIDNVTRKLMQEGKRPIGVGLFFSLGHSAVVIAMSVAVAFAAQAIPTRFGIMKAIGGVVSTSISALFLFAIALVNISCWSRSTGPSGPSSGASPSSTRISTFCSTAADCWLGSSGRCSGW